MTHERCVNTTVVVPALNSQASLDAVLGKLPPTVQVIVVDDGSSPPLSAAPPRTSTGVTHVTLIRHATNRGYGAAQKTGYAAALEGGAERVVLLHGDDQYDAADTLALADALADTPAALGSRFLMDPGVIPGWRRVGNRALTGLANLRFGTQHTELHSGARAFTTALLRSLPLSSYSDDYLFDQQVLCAILRAGHTIAERPVRVRYDDTVQSISLRRSITYGVGCVREILR